MPELYPYIDYALCVGCGACAEAMPTLFEIRHEQAWLINHHLFRPQEHSGIVNICVFGAISIQTLNGEPGGTTPSHGARGRTA